MQKGSFHKLLYCILNMNLRSVKKYFATRFYAQIVRTRLEYGLVINRLTAFQIKALEDAHNEYLRQIYGASK